MSKKQWGHGYHAGLNATKNKKVEMVGLYCHSRKEKNGDIICQGQIVQNVGDGNYMVQLFSWLTGHENGQELFHIEDMANWTFYETQEEWKNAGDRFWEYKYRNQYA